MLNKDKMIYINVDSYLDSKKVQSLEENRIDELYISLSQIGYKPRVEGYFQEIKNKNNPPSKLNSYLKIDETNKELINTTHLPDPNFSEVDLFKDWEEIKTKFQI